MSPSITDHFIFSKLRIVIQPRQHIRGAVAYQIASFGHLLEHIDISNFQLALQSAINNHRIRSVTNSLLKEYLIYAFQCSEWRTNIHTLREQAVYCAIDKH